MKRSKPTDRVTRPSNDSVALTGDLLPHKDARGDAEERFRRATRYSRISEVRFEEVTTEEVWTGLEIRDV